jgi:hypothetical protein
MTPLRFPHHPIRLAVAIALSAACLAAAVPAAAQTSTSPRAWGRVSFFSNVSRISPDGTPSITTSNLVTAVTLQLPDGEGNGMEYGLDMRHSAYSGPGRDPRVSVYDGYVGQRLAGGHLRVRVGQMWLTDLGALGSVGGGLVEYRQGPTLSAAGRLRVGAFVGAEPESYSLGYVAGIRKIGAYAALDGKAGRRHVVGYVRLSHSGLVERSVVTTTNFIPARSRLFVYQAAEFDLAGPAGQGGGGMTYMMINARVNASEAVELQGLYHRGRSIDTRTITDDVLNGRALRPGALEGLLYESTGGRVTVRVYQDIRVNAGYTRDRNNHDSASTGRLTLGMFGSNLAGTGLDVSISDSRIDRPSGRYSSIYASVGRQIGRVVYLTGDYSSSLSVVRFTRGDGITIETRPATKQFGISSVISIGRHISALITAERTRDDTSSDLRVLTGLTYRFR